MIFFKVPFFSLYLTKDEMRIKLLITGDRVDFKLFGKGRECKKKKKKLGTTGLNVWDGNPENVASIPVHSPFLLLRYF